MFFTFCVFFRFTNRESFEKKLIGNKKHLDKVFDFNGALELYQQIDLSYSLGTIRNRI
jgi:hypothetical protein